MWEENEISPEAEAGGGGFSPLGNPWIGPWTKVSSRVERPHDRVVDGT